MEHDLPVLHDLRESLDLHDVHKQLELILHLRLFFFIQFIFPKQSFSKISFKKR